MNISPRPRRVALLSTWNERCGIAHYSSFLKMALDPYLDITVIPLPRETMRDEKDFYKADAHIQTVVDQLHDFDVVCIQFEPSILGLTASQIRRRFRTILAHSRDLIVTFHSIPPTDYPNLSHLAGIRSLRAAYQAIASAHATKMWRSVYRIIAEHANAHKVTVVAHSKKDATTLRRLLPKVDVKDNPLSYMSTSYIDGMDEMVATSELPRLLPKLDKEVRFIGVFGFFGHQKGFDTAIMATKFLPEKYHLLMFSGAHEATLKAGEGINHYLDQLIKLVEKHKLSKRVHFIGTVSDNDLLLSMKLCDAAIMPYINSGQSASGPANQAVELDRPCYFSRSLQFLEMEKYLPNAFQFFDIGNYIELAQKIELGPEGTDRFVGQLRLVDFSPINRKMSILDTVENYLSAIGVSLPADERISSASAI